MVRKQGKRAVYIAAAILIGLLIVIGVAAAIKALNPGNDDPYKQVGVSTSDENANDDAKAFEEDTPKPSNTPSLNEEKPASTPALDPETVSSIDIQPMKLEVSYVKGVGGFEYMVQQTPNGTQYVEFRSSQLVGTKCTDDAGAFASIIESPGASESSTLSKKTTVDGTEYGLSLSANSCTSNPELLTNYQKSFSDAFTLLNKMS